MKKNVVLFALMIITMISSNLYAYTTNLGFEVEEENITCYATNTCSFQIDGATYTGLKNEDGTLSITERIVSTNITERGMYDGNDGNMFGSIKTTYDKDGTETGTTLLGNSTILSNETWIGYNYPTYINLSNYSSVLDTIKNNNTATDQAEVINSLKDNMQVYRWDVDMGGGFTTEDGKVKSFELYGVKLDYVYDQESGELNKVNVSAVDSQRNYGSDLHLNLDPQGVIIGEITFDKNGQPVYGNWADEAGISETEIGMLVNPLPYIYNENFHTGELTLDYFLDELRWMSNSVVNSMLAEMVEADSLKSEYAENHLSTSSAKEQHLVRRIYTVEEATEALGKNNKNTFSIKYR